jgi:hypothetical protein
MPRDEIEEMIRYCPFLAKRGLGKGLAGLEKVDDLS